MLISLDVVDVCAPVWSANKERLWLEYITGYKAKKLDPKFNHEDTYMIVFNKQSQSGMEEVFNTIKEFNILYKAPTAVNRNHGDYENRNTLYVFELK
jgi:hypothetical protein